MNSPRLDPRRRHLAAALAGVVAAAAMPSQALGTTRSYAFHPGGTPLAVPDNDLTPTVLDLEITHSGLSHIQSVEFDLHLAGNPENPGFAGDLVVFLVRDLEQTAFLLNRVGVEVGTGITATTGFAYSGWDLTFSDAAGSAGIHEAQPGPDSDLLTGLWAPDARAHPEDPSDLALFGLGTFTGAPADGIWRLAIVDASPGGTVWLEGATLRITGETATSVPESEATGAVAAVLLLGGVLLRKRLRVG